MTGEKQNTGTGEKHYTGGAFRGNFTQQEPLPEQAIANAVALMRTGRLHRYNTVGEELSETSELEREFASYMQSRFCLACASGGYAMHIALTAFGVKAGEPVLTNAFTLSPVPGAIHNAGAAPVLVETTRQLVIDLDHLEHQIVASGARVLLLSHMRGHIVDMDALCQLLETHQVALIEDCAHTMGASWGGRKSGSFGVAACFSTQTYKHINSGEGGLLVTNDDSLMARATLLSGSYMLYQRNGTVPDADAFEQAKYQIPNCSGRMDNLRAAILRPQLELLDQNCSRWNELYRTLEQALQGHKNIEVPERDEQESYVASSFQFLIDNLSTEQARKFVGDCKTHNVELKWFGSTEPEGFTSKHTSWKYIEPHSLSQTDTVLQGLFDLRLPLTFTTEDCGHIAEIIRHHANNIGKA